MLHNSKTKMFSPTGSTVVATSKKSKSQITTQLNPPSLNWLKRNIDKSKIPNKNLTSAGMICKDSKGHILFSNGNKIRDVSILVAKTIALRKALRAAAFRHMDNIMVENDSQNVVNFY